MKTDSWAVVVIFEDGGRRYYTQKGLYNFTDVRGNSVRFESENAALHVGYRLKDSYDRIADVEAEFIPKNPPLKRTGSVER